MFKRCLIAADGSEPSRQAALSFAKLGLADEGQVEVVGVLELDGVTRHGLFSLNEDERARILDNYRVESLEGVHKALEEAGLYVSQLHVKEGSAADAICELAEERQSELLVVGRRGLGRIADVLLGSVSRKVVEHAPCPVLVVPPELDETTATGHIVAPTDFSAAASGGVRLAAKIARSVGARLDLVHTVPPFRLVPLGYDDAGLIDEGALIEAHKGMVESARARLKDEAESLRKEFDLTVEAHFADADPADGVIEVARRVGARAIVLSSHGYTGLKKLWLGSVAESILRHAHCPVLIARVAT